MCTGAQFVNGARKGVQVVYHTSLSPPGPHQYGDDASVSLLHQVTNDLVVEELDGLPLDIQMESDQFQTSTDTGRHGVSPVSHQYRHMKRVLGIVDHGYGGLDLDLDLVLECRPGVPRCPRPRTPPALT